MDIHKRHHAGWGFGNGSLIIVIESDLKRVVMVHGWHEMGGKPVHSGHPGAVIEKIYFAMENVWESFENDESCTHPFWPKMIKVQKQNKNPFTFAPFLTVNNWIIRFKKRCTMRKPKIRFHRSQNVKKECTRMTKHYFLKFSAQITPNDTKIHPAT